ncbi:hypothetical protein BLOT_010967 [Blomia tropicalis]|nr:hypothetical protein BLOT_010967 [Blomia tropicalis]
MLCSTCDNRHEVVRPKLFSGVDLTGSLFSKSSDAFESRSITPFGSVFKLAISKDETLPTSKASDNLWNTGSISIFVSNLLLN